MIWVDINTWSGSPTVSDSSISDTTRVKEILDAKQIDFLDCFALALKLPMTARCDAETLASTRSLEVIEHRLIAKPVCIAADRHEKNIEITHLIMAHLKVLLRE